MKVVVVVDMQNDFIKGAVALPAAQAVVPAVRKRVEEAVENGERLVFLRDTHPENYLETLEGKGFPYVHCVEGSEGWEIISELSKYTENATVINKAVQGSVKLGETLKKWDDEEGIEKITFIGIYSDGCVLNNMIIARAFLPEVEMYIDASCVAALAPDGQKNAISILKTCLFKVENE